MKIAVSAESTVDLQNDLLEKFEISTIPFTVIMGENEYKDGEVTSADIFKFVAEKNILPKTSAINEFTYTEYFEGLLKNYDAVIHFALSSEISSACRNAQAAAENLKNVYIVDSRSLSTGIALLAIKAREMAQAGIDPKDIAKACTELTQKVQASFVLDKLNYMHKGGRCSKVALLGANLLKIKPQIVLENGKMVVGKKYMGNIDGCIKKYCKDTIEASGELDLNYAFITYTSATDNMVNAAEEALKQAGFRNIYKTFAGATITSHCGPNTLGILYIKA